MRMDIEARAVDMIRKGVGPIIGAARRNKCSRRGLVILQCITNKRCARVKDKLFALVATVTTFGDAGR